MGNSTQDKRSEAVERAIRARYPTAGMLTFFRVKAKYLRDLRSNMRVTQFQWVGAVGGLPFQPSDLLVLWCGSTYLLFRVIMTNDKFTVGLTELLEEIEA